MMREGLSLLRAQDMFGFSNEDGQSELRGTQRQFQ